MLNLQLHKYFPFQKQPLEDSVDNLKIRNNTFMLEEIALLHTELFSHDNKFIFMQECILGIAFLQSKPMKIWKRIIILKTFCVLFGKCFRHIIKFKKNENFQNKILPAEKSSKMFHNDF